jgi:hypothetical protein
MLVLQIDPAIIVALIAIFTGVLPVGVYLLLVGTFSSAKHISQDAELRKDFYKAAKNQLSLLRTIGVTQMEKELIKKFKSAEKRTDKLETIEDQYGEEEDVKQINA